MADLGTDCSTYPDLDVTFALRTGPHVVAEAVARRYLTPRGGGLFYDLNYGYDLRQYLNQVITPGVGAQISAQCESEANKDERVLGALVTVTQGPGQLASFAVHTVLQLSTGPFTFVLTVSAVAAQQTLVFGR